MESTLPLLGMIGMASKVSLHRRTCVNVPSGFENGYEVDQKKNIVVVTHAEFLLSLTNEDVEQGWANAEVRQYTFQTEDDNDEARLVFSKEEVQTGGVVPGDMS